MRHRIFPHRPFGSMTTMLWSLGGLFLTCAILLGCGTTRASAEVSHEFCAMEIQKLCRDLNEKLAESTGSFSTNHGNNTVMCGYLLETLKCVAGKAPPCTDWFWKVNSFYFQSPYDCKMTVELAEQIQEIKRKNLNGDENSESENTGDNDGSATTAVDETNGNGAVTSGKGGDVSESPGGGESEISPDSVTDSGQSGDGDGRYTVANAHGNKAQQAGNDSPTCSTLGMSLLISVAFMSRLISKHLML